MKEIDIDEKHQNANWRLAKSLLLLFLATIWLQNFTPPVAEYWASRVNSFNDQPYQKLCR